MNPPAKKAEPETATADAEVETATAEAPKAKAKKMVTVTMKGQVSGLRNGAEWPAPGETIEVPAAEAKRLARADLIVTDDDDDVIEV